jgi:hypothetical protein
MRGYALILAGAGFVMLATACGNQDFAATPAPGGISDSATGSGRVTDPPGSTAAQVTAADLQDRMRRIGSAATSIQMLLDEKNLEDVAMKAQEIATLLGDVEEFWAQNKRQDAITWAQQARQAATQTAGTAAAGEMMKAQMAAGTLMKTCEACHDAYREMDGHGGFRVKPGVIP